MSESATENKGRTDSGPEIHLGMSEGFIEWQFRDGEMHSMIVRISADLAHRGLEFIYSELWQISRPTLYMALPNQALRFVCPQELLDHESLGVLVKAYISTLHSTNQILLNNSRLKDIARNYDKILFYEFEHNDFHQAFEWARALDPNRVRHRYGQLGYNRAERSFDATHDEILELYPLIELIQHERIRKIVVVNMYYPQLFLNKHVHLPALLKFLGVELIMIDYDHYDTNPYTKAAYHCDDFQRYSSYETHQRPWDEAFKLKNIHYIPTGFSKARPNGSISLKPNYGIAIASHARAKDLLLYLKPLIYILENTGLENLYDGFQSWYYSFRHWLMGNPTISLEAKASYTRYLYLLYLAGISLLKYETLNGIKSDRPILLFGDAEWAAIFPKIYQGQYLSNYHEFFGRGEHINLLMNSSFSYYELNPVFSRALNLNAPFLCFPAFVKSIELQGMSHVEYQNPSDLSAKIETIEHLSQKPDFLSAKSKIHEVLHNGTEAMIRRITDLPQIEDPENSYAKHSEAQIQIATRRYEKRIREDHDFFESCFEILFQGSTLEVKLNNCILSDRDYIQRLLQLK